MSAPLSKKSIAGGYGAVGGAGFGITVAELVGQLPIFDDANPIVLKALGAIVVALTAFGGQRWVSWATKESEDFLNYAARQTGKLLVKIGARAGGPEPTIASFADQVNALAVKLDAAIDAGAVHVLHDLAPTPAVTVTSLPPIQPVVQAAPAAAPPDAPSGTSTQPDPAPTPEPDPVLSDEYEPPADAEPDPAFAD
jgi:hypothetical protein